MRVGFDRKLFSHFDWPLFASLILLIFVGLLNLYSATFHQSIVKDQFQKQVWWMALGFVLMLMVAFIDYRQWERFSYASYIITLVLLILVAVIGKTALGAKRWIGFGFFHVQPSELAKIAVAFVLAKYFHMRRDPRPLPFRQLLLPLILAGIPTALVLKQPDLGTSIIVLSVAGSIILFAGVRKEIIIGSICLGLVAAPLIWIYGLHQYQRDRVITFLNPEKDALGKGYQSIQARIAVGSGQLIGKGFKEGSQTKLEFLPKQHTDFVFSNFAEEFGFLGSSFVLVLFVVLALLGLNVALTAKDRFGLTLAIGMTAVIITQAWINLGMEIGLLPVVGVTLPFFSYGGTSLLTCFFAMGVLLNISMKRYVF